MQRTHLKRQQLLLVMQLFLSCWCVSLFGKLHVYVLFLKKKKNKPKTKTNSYFFLLCLLLVWRYSRAGKCIKSFYPKCLAQKATIFAVPMLLWIVFSCHRCIPSVFFFVSLLFQEQATKVVSKQPRLWFLVPSSLCIG